MQKAMKRKPAMKKRGGTVPGSKRTVSKPKSKRRTVKVVTKNPRPGSVGGTPTTTKTVTKKRGDKTITKTKSVRNPMNPFASSTVRKTKTVTRGSGPMKNVVSKKRSTKDISQKRGNRMQSRMQKRKGAITTTPRGS